MGFADIDNHGVDHFSKIELIHETIRRSKKHLARDLVTSDPSFILSRGSYQQNLADFLSEENT